MSATNRGAVRVEKDFYPTDPRVTRYLLRRAGHLFEPGVWWEPAMGAGAIVRAVEAWRPGAQRWAAADIRPAWTRECADLLRSRTVEECATGDFVKARLGARFRTPRVILTNPPFDIAEDFARECLRWAPPAIATTALLLRVGFVGATKRIAFWREFPADQYPLAPRPSFGLNKHGKKGTDASTYAWFVWGPKTSGRVFYPDRSWRVEGVAA